MVTGNVFDNANRTLSIEGATVRNLKTKNLVLTDRDGHFMLKAKKGDLITISMVGYQADTIYLVNIFPKNIYLVPAVNQLKGVAVEATKVSPYLGDVKDPNAQKSRMINIDKRRGGVRLALGYGKMKREREKVAKLEAEQEEIEAINQKFTAAYIKELVKFKGTDQELKDFIALYKPTVAQVKAEDPFNYDYYTAEAYHSWLRLPKEQRKLSPLLKLKTKP